MENIKREYVDFGYFSAYSNSMKYSKHPFFKPVPKVIAHRGDSAFFPENTLPAFESAQEIGVDCIETDVHCTKDGEVIIWHDDTLDRSTNGHGPVEQYTLNELKKLDAGYWFSGEDNVNHEKSEYPFRDRGIRMTTLHEALEALPEMKFNIDLKTESPAMVKAFVKVIEDQKAFSRVLGASFHQSNLVHLRKIAPQIITSFAHKEVVNILIRARLGLITQNSSFPGAVLQIPVKQGNIQVLNPKLIRTYKKAGLYVQVWTINKREEMERLLSMGADGIFTDNPRLLRLVADSLDA